MKFHDHSAHHAYYAVLQYMSAVLFGYYGETSHSIEVKANSDKKGTHVVILNSIYKEFPIHKRRKLKDNFHRLKKYRTTADYEDVCLRSEDCDNSIVYSTETLGLLKDHYDHRF